MRWPRALRLLTGLAAMTFVAASCGDNGGELADDVATAAPRQTPAQPDIAQGELHECAEHLPVPEGLSVVQSGVAQTQEGADTCLTAMGGDEAVEDVTAAYRSAFDDAGWQHETEQEDEAGDVLRFTDPECGFLVVVTGQAAGELGLVTPEQAQESATVALAQFIPCEDLPSPQE